jgi:hypothetical protein
MLILNGKIFNADSQAEDSMKTARQHYLECVKAIREKYGKYGYVKLVRRKPIRRNPSGLLEPIPMIIFPAKVHTNAQFATKTSQADKDKFGGMETWEYSAATPLKKEGDYRANPKSMKFPTQEKTFSLTSEMDLIYFLLYKSHLVYYPEAIQKYGKRSGGELMVDDKDERERIVAEGRKSEAKLNHAIYGDQESPLYDENSLRSIAAAWGVEAALDERVTADEVRNLLYEDVLQKQRKREKDKKGKGTDDFLDFIQYDELIFARALILDGINRKIIKYDMPKFTYVYAGSDLPIVIVPDKHRGRKFDYLCDYILAKTNTVAWEKLRKEIISPEYIDAQSFKWVKWLARTEELPIASKSERELRDALKDRYK